MHRDAGVNTTMCKLSCMIRQREASDIVFQGAKTRRVQRERKCFGLRRRVLGPIGLALRLCQKRTKERINWETIKGDTANGCVE